MKATSDLPQPTDIDTSSIESTTQITDFETERTPKTEITPQITTTTDQTTLSTQPEDIESLIEYCLSGQRFDR